MAFPFRGNKDYCVRTTKRRTNYGQRLTKEVEEAAMNMGGKESPRGYKAGMGERVFGESKSTNNDMALEFNVPDGCVFDKDSVTIKDGKVTIDLKEKQRFSKNWKEFCKNNDIDTSEGHFDRVGIFRLAYFPPRDEELDTTMIPTKFAEPMRALMQLLTIREKEYTKGWEPDWGNLNGGTQIAHLAGKTLLK